MIRQSHRRSHFGSALFSARSLPRLTAPQARVLTAARAWPGGVTLLVLACLLYARKDRKPAWSIRYVRAVVAVLVRIGVVEFACDGAAVLESGRHPKVLTIPG